MAGEAPSVARAKAVLDATKSIYSKIDPDSGKRIFYCPEFDCGVFNWSKGPKSMAELDTDLRDDGKARAFGKCEVDAGYPITLAIDMGRNRELYNNPEFLKKFGPNEISGLRLSCEASVEEYADEEFKVLARAKVNKVMDCVDGWKDLHLIDFYHVSATNHALDILDHRSTLKRFLARESNVDGPYFAQKKFVKGLTSLEVSNLENMDPLLEGLKGSSAIRYVYVGNAGGSVRGINALATCPNLQILFFDNIEMDDQTLAAIANIKSLRRLKLSRCRAGVNQLPVLLKFKNIDVVDLELLKWPPEEKQKLWALMPCSNPRLRFKLLHDHRLPPAP